MGNPSGSHGSLVRSYLALRKGIGLIGVALPFVLAFGLMIARKTPAIETSISAYYHTIVGDVFVGALCAIGVFLWSYRGYDERDNFAGNLACMFAIGVALFPTTPAEATRAQAVIGKVHYAFAAALFLTLAYFCLRLFPKTTSANPTRRKLQRNRVYLACGKVILMCIVAIGGLALLPQAAAIKSYSPVFWLEATAIVAFGMSWLTKGEAILADELETVPATQSANAG